MTELKCSVRSCSFQKDDCCCRGNITVEGAHANRNSETSCGSFQERSGSSMANSFTNSCGCEKIQIDCKAHNCTYNENCKCTAAAIDVAGSGAKVCSETKCDTFECQC